MERLTSDEAQVFENVETALAANARAMMLRLNEGWRALGVDAATRLTRTRNLVDIVQDTYDDIVDETEERLRVVRKDIQRLAEERSELSDRLGSSLSHRCDRSDTLVGQRQALHDDVEALRAEYERRLERIREANERLRKLSERLGLPPKTLPEAPLPTDHALEDFKLLVRQREDDYEKRLAFFVERQRQIRSLITELELKNYDSFVHYILESSTSDFNVTDTNMAQLLLVVENLTDQLEQKKTEILKMRERLDSLWERLMESPSRRVKFTAKHTGYSDSTKRALICEINRCEEKKRDNFKQFVQKLRSDISELWKKCKYSQLEMDRFVDYQYDDGYNEDILTSHEKYLESLQNFYEDNKIIFNLYETRQSLWLKWDELEGKSHEPDRYKNRGGQLLREEKDRKAVSNQLPKIEKELTQLAEEYEERCGKPFTIEGHSLIQIIEEDWQNKNERKNKLSVRKQQPLSKTQVPRSAPASNRLLPMLNKETLTAVKRHLNPHRSLRAMKHMPSVSQRLHFTPDLRSNSAKCNNKHERPTPVPVLAINGSIKKRKFIGRLSQDSKGKKRSRRSKTSRVEESSTTEDPSCNSTTYLDFQDHIHSNVQCRSSIRNLRPRNLNAEASKYKPDGKSACARECKENHTAYGSNFNTPIKDVDRKTKIDMNVFATPVRPASKANKTASVQRQNTVMLASPSAFNTQRNLRRSNSASNIRSHIQSPKIKFTSELRLIM